MPLLYCEPEDSDPNDWDFGPFSEHSSSTEDPDAPTSFDIDFADVKTVLVALDRNSIILAEALAETLSAKPREEDDGWVFIRSGELLIVFNRRLPEFPDHLARDVRTLQGILAAAAPEAVFAVSATPRALFREPPGADGLRFYALRHPDTPPPPRCARVPAHNLLTGALAAAATFAKLRDTQLTVLVAVDEEVAFPLPGVAAQMWARLSVLLQAQGINIAGPVDAVLERLARNAEVRISDMYM
eukprot:gnl/Chilomastix_cuspidata/2927.p1 GENE.gnl/Chilomastix_cuspidata/2927~~gnl/Chilomastix_cuspidata/2927.p1  ORF type:complete len:243 (+),score=87.22 gnl/Chilomastix_cuspidata/2927:873-1601(+)